MHFFVICFVFFLVERKTSHFWKLRLSPKKTHVHSCSLLMSWYHRKKQNVSNQLRKTRLFKSNDLFKLTINLCKKLSDHLDGRLCYI